MSNNQSLLMKYHPARKEIEFHRFQNNIEVEIPSHSKLKSYMNRRGKFVLQDYGNEFFQDIANAFDGLESVDIQVITTELDFEDFRQMVEFYNMQNPTCKMTPQLVAVLPNMETTFEQVRDYGKKAISVLSDHKEIIGTKGSSNAIVHASAEQFITEINQKVSDIKTKIDSLYDNHVSICFAGVYSAGKSALINAILGYAILPEAKTSETAKMFCISSPKDNDVVQISFLINGELTVLKWDSEAAGFVFTSGPVENTTKATIQKLLNEEKDKSHPQYQQIRTILSELNDHHDVSSSINIGFPVPLDSEQVQFTIYDTPGTDSNFVEHQDILYEALQEQKQSILVFVIHPEKSEGEGNNSLLEYLKRVSEESKKTSIDLNRSLFVINHADGVKASEREELRCREIQNTDDRSISINLADKKVLFTSALYAYAAKAVANNIATDDDKWHFDDCAKLKSSRSPYGPCYQQNRCAMSECSTNRIIQASVEKAKAADQAADEVEKLIVCSGLFSLEQEIKLYGERYASAVKAYAIIDSVDKALVGLNNEANLLQEENIRETSEIEQSISDLKGAIDSAISSAYDEFICYTNLPLASDICRQLKLDQESITAYVGKVRKALESFLKGWFFGILGKVRISDENRKSIQSYLNRMTTTFVKSYGRQRTCILEKQRDSFIDTIRKAILCNSDISNEAKQYVLNIPDITVDCTDMSVNIEQICNDHKQIDKILLLFPHEVLDDKDDFIQDVETELLEMIESLAMQFSQDYSQSLTRILNEVRSQFKNNMESYSIKMRGLIDNKAAMIMLGDCISDAASALATCQSELDEIIWKEGPHKQ